jgi:hypothetical protein
MRLRRFAAVSVALLFAILSLSVAAEQKSGPPAHTPPRLALIEGEASFWRPGAEDWGPARVNTPLAPGDVVYTGDDSNIELQIGPRMFIRAGRNTQLRLANQEADFLQFEITTGRVSLDLRTLPSGYTVEVDTPNAVYTIERTGYYRVDVAGESTHFITRRGGRATVTPAAGSAQSIAASEEVVVTGTGAPKVESYVAPELDDWDRWNYARTDHQVDAVSARYVAPEVYGAEALDHYGYWRVVPRYGSVWIPDGVPPGWVPYSTGSWIWDPFYGWTWVDAAPWGWAPYHYGRWVYVDSYWAWAPGPIIARPAYAPALVAFYGMGRGVSVRIGFPLAGVGWVALGWGEPLVPWWGPAHFVGAPWWGGWGGPRVVNNVVIRKTTIVNVKNITYVNAGVSNAVVAVRADRFGRGGVHEAREHLAYRPGEFAPIRGALPVKPAPASLVPDRGAAIRPPADVASRPVVATRRSHAARLPWQGEAARPTPSATATEPRLVPPPSRQRVQKEGLPRAPFGAAEGPERPRPPLPPRFGAEGAGSRAAERREAPQPSRIEEAAPGAREAAPRRETRERRAEPPRERPAQEHREFREPSGREGMAPGAREAAPRREFGEGRRESAGARPDRETRALPGKPANRLYPRHGREDRDKAR